MLLSSGFHRQLKDLPTHLPVPIASDIIFVGEKNPIISFLCLKNPLWLLIALSLAGRQDPPCHGLCSIHLLATALQVYARLSSKPLGALAFPPTLLGLPSCLFVQKVTWFIFKDLLPGASPSGRHRAKEMGGFTALENTGSALGSSQMESSGASSLWWLHVRPGIQAHTHIHTCSIPPGPATCLEGPPFHFIQFGGISND